MCDIHSFANRFTQSTIFTRTAHKLPSLGPGLYLVSPTKIDYYFREVITFLVLCTQIFLTIYHSLVMYMRLYVIYASDSFYKLCTLLLFMYNYCYVYVFLILRIFCPLCFDSMCCPVYILCVNM
jgi:hypothetical protein